MKSRSEKKNDSGGGQGVPGVPEIGEKKLKGNENKKKAITTLVDHYWFYRGPREMVGKGSIRRGAQTC